MRVRSSGDLMSSSFTSNCRHSRASVTLPSERFAVSKNRFSFPIVPNPNVTSSPPFSPRASKTSRFAPVRSYPPRMSPQSCAGFCHATAPQPLVSLNSQRRHIAPVFGCSVLAGSSFIAFAFPIQPDGM